MTMKIDIFIKNALIYDGTRSEPFAGDIGISGDRIVFIHRMLEGTRTVRDLSYRTQHEDDA